MKLCSVCMCWTVACETFDEPRFKLLVNKSWVLGEFVEAFARVLLPLSEVELELLFSSFFVLRKRPPLPLALLIAWRWRDSWRYGCKKWMKHLYDNQFYTNGKKWEIKLYEYKTFTNTLPVTSVSIGKWMMNWLIWIIELHQWYLYIRFVIDSCRFN